MDLRESNQLIKEPNRHPWELSRMEMMVSLIRKNIKKRFREKDNLTIVDVGSGDAFFMKSLARHFSKGDFYAVDKHYEKGFDLKDGVKLIKELKQLPSQIDVLIMMDVIEHVEDDKTFLKEVTQKLKNGGLLFITVPAFNFLFSKHDTFLGHFRRYDKKMLKEVVLTRGMNLEIMSTFYFYTSLFKIRCLQKLLKIEALEGGVGQWQHPQKHSVTLIFKWMLNFDFLFNLLVKIFPGLSLCMICQKKR